MYFKCPVNGALSNAFRYANILNWRLQKEKWTS